MNLYGFLGNNQLNETDYLGLVPDEEGADPDGVDPDSDFNPTAPGLQLEKDPSINGFLEGDTEIVTWSLKTKGSTEGCEEGCAKVLFSENSQLIIKYRPGRPGARDHERQHVSDAIRWWKAARASILVEHPLGVCYKKPKAKCFHEITKTFNAWSRSKYEVDAAELHLGMRGFAAYSEADIKHYGIHRKHKRSQDLVKKMEEQIKDALAKCRAME